MKVLVTGGVRSGKSAHAEELLADRDHVTYVATGPEPTADDPAWTARVRAHQERRPAGWSTAQTVPPDGAVLLDSLGTWVATRLDVNGYEAEVDALLAALDDREDLVVVTDEVGLGGVGAHPTARLFADRIGELNQRVAALCDEVHLVVAGRVLVL